MKRRSSILIVDDRPENLVALEKLLGDFDCIIVKANSGNEALTLTLTHEFALALIDVQMPDMDGYETVRLMRNVEQTKYLPVIFLSAIYSENHYQIQGIEAGAVDFISKPIHPRILQGKVKVFLDLYEQRRRLEEEIEQRKKTENELRHAEQEISIARDKAEEADRLKTAFLANMSHEIRTPLNAIVGFSNLLADTEIEEAKKRQYLEYINNSSESLTTLINDIIDISKIEAGQLEIVPEPARIIPILNELEETTQVVLKRLSKEHIQCRAVYPDSLGDYTLFLDGMRLKQVFLNLLTNASKFTHEGRIEFGFRLDKNAKPVYFVSDTGIGISEEMQKIVFNPFRQVAQEDNANVSGTGLGLSIVKRIVELMGGTINLKSRLGEGSRFEFTLRTLERMDEPLPEVPKTAVRKSPEISIAGGLEILVAEDEMINFELLRAVLPQDVALTWAQDGQEAISMAKEQSFDIVLMDLKMPVKTGYQALREIREFAPNLPIIAQTAYAMDGEKDSILDFGFDGYIPKPINKAILLDLIASLTNSKQDVE